MVIVQVYLLKYTLLLVFHPMLSYIQIHLDNLYLYFHHRLQSIIHQDKRLQIWKECKHRNMHFNEMYNHLRYTSRIYFEIDTINQNFLFQTLHSHYSNCNNHYIIQQLIQNLSRLSFLWMILNNENIFFLKLVLILFSFPLLYIVIRCLIVIWH